MSCSEDSVAVDHTVMPFTFYLVDGLNSHLDAIDYHSYAVQNITIICLIVSI